MIFQGTSAVAVPQSQPLLVRISVMCVWLDTTALTVRTSLNPAHQEPTRTTPEQKLLMTVYPVHLVSHFFANILITILNFSALDNSFHHNILINANPYILFVAPFWWQNFIFPCNFVFEYKSSKL